MIIFLKKIPQQLVTLNFSITFTSRVIKTDIHNPWSIDYNSTVGIYY